MLCPSYHRSVCRIVHSISLWMCQYPRSRPNSGIPFSPCFLSVHMNESWSRFLWCPRPHKKICVCCSARASGAGVYPRTTGTDFCVAPDHGEKWASDSARASALRRGADRGSASAPDHGENCGRCTWFTTGARTESRDTHTTRLAQLILWVSTSRVWTSKTCLDLEM